MNPDHESRPEAAREIPAFRAAEKLSRTVNAFALEIYSRRERVRGIDTLHRKAVLITANIAAGHAFGYEEDIRRNLSLCRQARASSKECEEAVNQLAQSLQESGELAEIEEMLTELRVSLEKWVRELEALDMNPDD